MLTGFAGQTEWDKARADMVVYCVEDMIEPLAIARNIADEQRRVNSLIL